MRHIVIFLYGAWRLILVVIVALMFVGQFVPERVIVNYFRDPAVVEFLEDLEPHLDRSAGDREIERFEENFAKAFDRIMEDHVDPPDADALIDGAWAGVESLPATPDGMAPASVTDATIEAMLAALNTRFIYFDPEVMQKVVAQRFEDPYSGIGLRQIKDGPESVAVMLSADGPARRAGVRYGDQIVAIDHQAIRDWTQREVSERLAGDIGTDVTVTLRRTGGEDFDLTMRRELVTYQYVQARLIGSIGHIRVQWPYRTSDQQLSDSIARLQRQAVPALDGIVLDLRDVRHGRFDRIVAMADLFLDEGVLIATSEGRSDATPVRHEAAAPDLAAGVPIVVLVNHRTTGLAQALAAALQENGRASVVGATSPGGAFALSYFRMRQERGFWMATSRVYSPLGRPVDEAGIEPDLHILATGEAGSPAGRHVDPDRCASATDEEDRAVDCAISVLETGGIDRFLAQIRE